MSADAHAVAADPGAVHREPIKPGLDAAALEKILIEQFNAKRDARDRWNLTLVIGRDRLRDAVRHLRDEPALRFNQLLDVAGIDYLAYPGHRGARFAVTYLFKSTVFRHRIALKVELDEDDAVVPTLSDLFPIADWSERETWDQIGIVFSGHPNLKRLLNHHEFVGHPLRKDYPCQKRQKLSVNDPMIDQLEGVLMAQGWQVIDRGATGNGIPADVPKAEAKP